MSDDPGGLLVRSKERAPAVALAALLLTAPLVLAFSVWAQEPTGTQATKPLVPANLAEHQPPVQPIPYSHKTHLALGLECQTCHTYPEPGKLMTYPATSTCMSCHATVAKSKPAIQKLATFAKSQQDVPWVRVYAVLPGVNWTHRKHLDAGMKCETCHGEVAQMEAMSEATSVTTMGVCISCHKANNAPTVCQTCHAWPAGE
jgi:hypothetical protein